MQDVQHIEHKVHLGPGPEHLKDLTRQRAFTAIWSLCNPGVFLRALSIVRHDESG